VSNENNAPAGRVELGSKAASSSVGQTANIGRATALGGGAAKVFREFKWGLLALFLLMAVVIGLVYDGGRKKKNAPSENNPKAPGPNAEALIDSSPEPGLPPGTATPGTAVAQTPGTNSPAGKNSTPLPGDAANRPAKSGAPIIIDTQPPQPPVNPPAHTSGADAHLATGPGAPPDSQKGAPGSYTVVPGDTLTSIAIAYGLGKGGVKAILDANKDVLSNPNKLRVGLTIKIPAACAQNSDSAPNNKKTGSGSVAPGNTASPKADSGSEYVVQNGDSLERIARKLFNDGRKWRDLFDWNRDQLSDPARLRAGQTLKIKPASSHTTVSLPSPGAPRAEAEEGPQPLAEAPVSTAEQPSGEAQVMSTSSSASLP
jgi:nucleoid-associated protein YgaU